ncbi:hypothetical protein [Desulfovibrio gilichinskyi]|uniref:Uncharacterized protein n=1 Tax=Desulfovibrio gilichinskyi TaxID=1519643 RepID=A0A1X7CGY4_9BACT|nr:hypothetical protein [Desulfovibrio gilichinskyi]SME95917.1 hypothetical protein SAMN06295933_0847 [Desulfovibrio gilichinskyi]
MNHTERNNLIIRLNNCLETILELEQDLEKLDLNRNFLEELEVLKEFMQKVEKVQINEDDVQRIETATGSFLKELRHPLRQLDSSKKLFMRLQ